MMGYVASLEDKAMSLAFASIVFVISVAVAVGAVSAWVAFWVCWGEPRIGDWAIAIAISPVLVPVAAIVLLGGTLVQELAR